MSKFVGRRGSLGVAVETARGTAVAPTFWIPYVTMSFGDKVEEVREEQGFGVLADSDSKFVTMRMGEGEVEAQLYDKALGAILTGVMGASPSTGGSYTHTYTLSNTNQPKTVTLYWEDPDRNFIYKLGTIDSFNISVEPNGIVNYKIGFKSKASKGYANQAQSFTSLGNKFLHQHLSFKLATDVASLAAATAISLKKLDFTINKNAAFDSVIGTVEPEDILTQQLSVEGSLELNLEDDTYKSYMLDGTYRAMEIKFTKSATSSLQIQLPRVDFSEWEADYSLNEIAKQTINFKANYDAANGLDIISTCVLINSQAGGSY
jgi:hypothetical protein